MIKSNEYFEGRVKSLALETGAGPATVGVMEAGEYEFGTSSPELMRVISGKLLVQLPGESSFSAYVEGSEFRVPAGVKFKLKVPVASSYICWYG